MIKITFENIKGEQFQIIPNQDYLFTGSDGLDAPQATINTSPNGSVDGDVFIHSRVEKRVMNLYFNVMENASVEKLTINRYVQTKKYVKMIVETQYRHVQIEGYVADVTINPHAKPVTMQLSLEFPRPFFNGVNEIIALLSSITDDFYFDFYIEDPITIDHFEPVVEKNVINYGDRETGFIIEIDVKGDVLNPKIYNRDTTEMIGLDMGFVAGDKVTINTKEGEKGAKLLRDGVEYNIFNAIAENSVFLQLQGQGADNVFTYTADDGDEYMRITFRYTSLFDSV